METATRQWIHNLGFSTITSTDVSLQRDNRVAEDLKQALQELVILWRIDHSGVSVGSSSLPTGTLIDCDTTGKVKPLKEDRWMLKGRVLRYVVSAFVILAAALYCALAIYIIAFLGDPR